MYVYILKSQKGNGFYVGVTDNMEERLQYHNRGYNLSTKAKAPWKLVKVENYNNTSLALKREKFLKTGRGREVVRNFCLLENK